MGVLCGEEPLGDAGLEAALGVAVRGGQLQGHLVLVAEGRAGALAALLLRQLLSAAGRRARDLVRPVEEGVVHLEKGAGKTQVCL